MWKPGSNESDRENHYGEEDENFHRIIDEEL